MNVFSHDTGTLSRRDLVTKCVAEDAFHLVLFFDEALERVGRRDFSHAAKSLSGFLFGGFVSFGPLHDFFEW